MKKTNEEFLSEINLINPDIRITSEYITARTYVTCVCKVCNYEWRAMPTNLLRGRGCPRCHKVHHRTEEEFLSELQTVNTDVFVVENFTNMRTKVKCRCAICGNEWSTLPSSLIKGYGCPNCAIDKIKTKNRRSHDEYIRQLYENNNDVEILSQYVNSSTKVRAKCKKCGKEWLVFPYSLLQGTGCPECAGNTKKGHNQFVKELNNINPDIIIKSTYVNAHTKIRCFCVNCGHNWDSKPNNLLNGQGCPNCNRRNHTSFGEQAAFYYIKHAYPDAYSSYNDLGYELDIYIPSIKTAIEYDGEYWHRDKEESDIKKDYRCDSDDIHLIRLREAGLNPTPIADIIIVEDSKDEKELNRCIEELMRLLGKEKTIDITRDRQTIMSQYYTKLGKESLGDEYPQIALEWNNEKNGDLNPSMFTLKSGKKVWWKCAVCGYEWEAKIIERVRGNGCPKCGVEKRRKKQAKTHDQFIEELNEINKDIIITGKYVNTNTKVSCICKKCGYSWNAKPSKLLIGQSCPKCAGKVTRTTSEFISDLSKINPCIEVIGDYVNTSTKVSVKCSICNYKWTAKPANLLSGYGCPECGKKRSHNKLRLTQEQFLERMRIKGNSNVMVLGDYINAKAKIKCKCKQCGFEWSATPNSLFQGHGCPNCGGEKKNG